MVSAASRANGAVRRRHKPHSAVPPRHNRRCAPWKARAAFSTAFRHFPDSKRDSQSARARNQQRKPHSIGVIQKKNTRRGVFHFGAEVRFRTCKFPVDTKELDSRMVVESGWKWSKQWSPWAKLLITGAPVVF